FTDVPAGWYTLKAEVQGVTIAESGFEITEYTKPELKIEVTSNKQAVFSGEEVEFTARMQFYDGTAAGSVPVKIYETRSGKSQSLTTNENGEVKYVLKTNNQSQSILHPEGIHVTPGDAYQGTEAGYGGTRAYDMTTDIVPST